MQDGQTRSVQQDAESRWAVASTGLTGSRGANCKCGVCRASVGFSSFKVLCWPRLLALIGTALDLQSSVWRTDLFHEVGWHLWPLVGPALPWEGLQDPCHSTCFHSWYPWPYSTTDRQAWGGAFAYRVPSYSKKRIPQIWLAHPPQFTHVGLFLVPVSYCTCPVCPSLHWGYFALITLFWVLSQELVWLYSKPRPWDSILVILGSLLICVTFRVQWLMICSHTHLCTCGVAFWSALGWICRLSWETCHLSVIEFSNLWTSHISPFI